jgi:hypothetical protein
MNLGSAQQVNIRLRIPVDLHEYFKSVAAMERTSMNEIIATRLLRVVKKDLKDQREKPCKLQSAK